MADWKLIEELDRRIEQFVGLGATDAQIRRLLDNWHIISALATGRLSAVFEEFVPVHAEWEVMDIDWDVWEEKLRHYPVRLDRSTSLRERMVRAGISACTSSAEVFVGMKNMEEGVVETLRLKILRNKRPVTDVQLSAMLSAKLLKPATLPHLLEFAAQHPDSVTPNLLAVGSRAYTQAVGGEDHVEIPCLRRSMIEDRRRVERVTLMTAGFEEQPGGMVYPARQTFLVVRYPLRRGEDGKPISE